MKENVRIYEIQEVTLAYNMSKFDRKELSIRVYAILEMIESYTEDRHTKGSRFINANTRMTWELLEDILTDQVQEVLYSTETCKVCHEGAGAFDALVRRLRK